MTNKKEYTRFKSVRAVLIISLFIYFFHVCFSFSFLRGLIDGDFDYYGKSTYLELARPYSLIVQKKLEPLVKDVDDAMSSFYKNYEEAEEAWGEELAGFTHFRSAEKSEVHYIKYLAGGFMGDHAYIWIEYWNRRYDEDGNSCGGSGSVAEPIKIRFTAEKIDDEWVITGRRERP